ncbi:MAG: hypothetical protein PHF37_11175 [Phycisphaerae bacterium]|nr:hypothetical protein [Phycisphaerae bacterium]
MKESAIHTKLSGLIAAIGGTNQVNSSVDVPSCGEPNVKVSTDTTLEMLEYLSICIKYQCFDLEATRRENKYLHQILEGKD